MNAQTSPIHRHNDNYRTGGKGWRSECMQGFMSAKEREAEAKKQAKADKLKLKI
ncbi:hypothetical protein [Vibrio vulnificus]|uniref:hypothetical protein n=1 Tax=Vibrio vulnificus TaxID=672 RepID=UPI003EDA4E39